MATSYECSSCGNIISSTDDKCPYCGTVRSFNKSNNDNSSNNNFNNNFFSKETNESFRKVNWLLFIILLVLFWPAAIIYLLVKTQEK